MKRKTITYLVVLIVGIQTARAQNELDAIRSTLMDYIEGTAKGEPDRVKRAFHPELNLYSVRNDSVNIWYGQSYIEGISPGKKSNRIGRIVSIDFENNAAVAKIEIVMPGPKRIYTDYVLLLKYQEQWKIIHKSFTYVDFPE